MSDVILKALADLETKLSTFATKAELEAKHSGSESAETKAALEKLSEEQVALARRISEVAQIGTGGTGGSQKAQTAGEMFTKSDGYADFIGGRATKVRVEVKNTLTGSDTTVAPDRKPGIVGGPFVGMTIESLIPGIPTSSNAIEYTREATYTNSAAETAEGAAKPESAVTFSLQSMPVSTIAHWIKISRQLASDSAALAAYVDTRMRYGVDLRVNTQLVSGNGVAPNLSGLMATGNFTPHGYTAASLGAAGVSATNRVDLVRLVIADMQAAGYMPSAILLNPIDFAKVELTKSTTGEFLLAGPGGGGNAAIWRLPVLEDAAVAAGKFLVGAFAQAATRHLREGLVVAMSESDSDNFTKNLITIRAERRLALTVEVPAALRGGDLVPA